MKQFILSFLISVFLFGCSSTRTPVTETGDDGLITFKFIQLNDVYEIAPLSGGQYGGMARVAHVRDSVAKVNPNTFLFMAGDFLNPSLLGTIKLQGERIAGRQMIEVMNAMNFDLVTFGNHEFDISEEALQERLNESNFTWVSANVLQVQEDGNKPFSIQRDVGNIPIPRTYKRVIRDKDGTEVTVGFISVTVPSNPRDYVLYGDIYTTAVEANEILKDQSDITIGFTHLTIDQDKELLKYLPNLPLIMGGHEHNNMLVTNNGGVIAKADANAKTVYIHTLTYNVHTKQLNIDSHLMPIDDTTPSKPSVKAIVDKWNSVLDAQIKQVIDNPNEIIYRAVPPLDGTDSANRSTQTNLGGIITRGMSYAYNNDMDAVIVNSGSFRVDDMLEGDISTMDIFRVLPFGGSIVRVKMKGSLLNEVLDYGKEKRGNGAYLQRYLINVNSANGKWMIKDEQIDDEKTYTIATSDFLMLGYDIPFLTESHPGVIEVYHPKENETAYDIRKAVILYLKSLKK
ncbi:bifunctional metallophosphatase/5'-nucleotidase [Constantimarinum furrinae]|nr:bifunctional metallophosphatase/5'-nucleotidase [Constantimarinum furrinae]